MLMRYVLLALSLVVLQACSTTACEKIQPYQQTVASEPLAVPADLSEPPLRGQAPDVAPNAPVRRADGGCLELPPPFEPEKGER